MEHISANPQKAFVKASKVQRYEVFDKENVLTTL